VLTSCARAYGEVNDAEGQKPTRLAPRRQPVKLSKINLDTCPKSIMKIHGDPNLTTHPTSLPSVERLGSKRDMGRFEALRKFFSTRGFHT